MPTAVAVLRPSTRSLTAAVASLACAVLLALCAQARANPGPDHEVPTAEELVSRYIEAVGGFEALESLNSRVAKVSLVTDLQWDEHIREEATLSVYGLSSGEYLVVTETEAGTIIEGFDGTEDWKVDPSGLVRKSNPRTFRDTWLTDPQFPIKLIGTYPSMRSTGVEQWNEDTVYAVDVGDGEDHRLGFDPETGLLIRLGYHIWLEDYEEVDGVLCPRRVVHGRKGGSSTFAFDAIDHNERLDRSIFSLAK